MPDTGRYDHGRAVGDVSAVGAPGAQHPAVGTRLQLEPLTVETLRAHREVYASLAAHLPRCSMHVFDRDLRFVFAGGPALEEAGFDPAQLEGRTLWETVPAEWADLFAKHYRRALAGEDVDFDHVSPLGPVFHTRIRPVRDPDGQVVAGLLVSEDITAQRAVLTELADTADLENGLVLWGSGGRGSPAGAPPAS